MQCSACLADKAPDEFTTDQKRLPASTRKCSACASARGTATSMVAHVDIGARSTAGHSPPQPLPGGPATGATPTAEADAPAINSRREADVLPHAHPDGGHRVGVTGEAGRGTGGAGEDSVPGEAGAGDAGVPGDAGVCTGEAGVPGGGRGSFFGTGWHTDQQIDILQHLPLADVLRVRLVCRDLCAIATSSREVWSRLHAACFGRASAALRHAGADCGSMAGFKALWAVQQDALRGAAIDVTGAWRDCAESGWGQAGAEFVYHYRLTLLAGPAGDALWRGADDQQPFWGPGSQRVTGRTLDHLLKQTPRERAPVLARVFGAARLGLVDPEGVLEGHGAAQWFGEVAPHGGDAIPVNGHFQWHLGEETDPGLLRVYNGEMLRRAASAEHRAQAGGVASDNGHAHAHGGGGGPAAAGSKGGGGGPAADGSEGGGGGAIATGAGHGGAAVAGHEGGGGGGAVATGADSGGAAWPSLFVQRRCLEYVTGVFSPSQRKFVVAGTHVNDAGAHSIDQGKYSFTLHPDGLHVDGQMLPRDTATMPGTATVLSLGSVHRGRATHGML